MATPARFYTFYIIIIIITYIIVYIILYTYTYDLKSLIEAKKKKYYSRKVLFEKYDDFFDQY